ncbi:MAG: hypothetical protein KME46_25950 [Brasilonema angustatum HA4187-MV1]|nr:hypothetical protein [Brasilonema angustatum HA4187-MV1]
MTRSFQAAALIAIELLIHLKTDGLKYCLDKCFSFYFAPEQSIYLPY